MATPSRPDHTWRFTQIGGFAQPRMETAADFASLEHLDQKLWAALACPVKGLAFDVRTLSLLDHDDDGRIRAPEVIGAATWCRGVLKGLDSLAAGGQDLPLSQIDAESPEGAVILASAQKIAAGATSLSVADATAAATALAKAANNGDGVVPAAAAQDDVLAALIGEIVGALEGVPDRGGDVGVDQALVDRFFSDAQAVVDWTDAADDDAHPLGAATAAAADAVAAVKAKVDDFFARCRLAAFDARALTALNRKEEEYLAIAAADLSVTADEVSGFPLARVEAGRALPLVDAVNPAWAGRLAALRSAAVAPLLGDAVTELTEPAWGEIQAKLADFEAWRAGKPDTPVAGLGADRLRELLGSDHQAGLTALIATDAAAAPKVAAIDQVEKLVRYHRDLFQLAQNFVNLTHFYSDTERATFEAGTLYLDGRACELVVRVDDAGKHAALAGSSKLYLAYCQCTRPSGEKLQIAAAFTDGDADYLMVGRNGVFYDRDGKDWDATITKVVDNPISLRQAFWAPYRKIAQMLEERAAAAAESKAEAAKKDATAQAGTVGGGAGDAKPPSIDVGTVAAIAVGLGALGSMAVALIGYITGLFSMPFWIIVLVLAAVFLAISAPSVVMAWFKLRKRSLGPILDSNGWAINGRANVSVRFGRTMTHVARLPAGARVDSKDKYADPANPWPGILLTLVAIGFLASLLNWFGVIHTLSGGLVGDPAGDLDALTAAESVEAAPADAAAPAE